MKSITVTKLERHNPKPRHITVSREEVVTRLPRPAVRHEVEIRQIPIYYVIHDVD